MLTLLLVAYLITLAAFTYGCYLYGTREVKAEQARHEKFMAWAANPDGEPGPVPKKVRQWKTQG